MDNKDKKIENISQQNNLTNIRNIDDINVLEKRFENDVNSLKKEIEKLKEDIREPKSLSDFYLKYFKTILWALIVLIGIILSLVRDNFDNYRNSLNTRFEDFNHRLEDIKKIIIRK